MGDRTFTFTINDRASCYINAIGTGIEYADLFVQYRNSKIVNKKPVFRAKLNYFMDRQEIPFMWVLGKEKDHRKPIHLGLLRPDAIVTVQLHVRRVYDKVDIELVLAKPSKQKSKEVTPVKIVQNCKWCGLVDFRVVYYGGLIYSGVPRSW